MNNNRLSLARSKSQSGDGRQRGQWKKGMLFRFTTVVFILLAASLLFLPAQQAFPVPLPQAGEQGGWQNGGRHARRHNEMRFLSRALNLTKQQKAQIKPILEHQHKAMMALRQDTSLSRQERRSKFMALRKQTMEKIRPILTSEQQAKLQQMEQRREERMQQWRQQHEGSGSPGSAPQSQ
ncbi:MAG: Spy/CpxP family protein refolding chaperone [Terriglobia bacterium]